MSNRLEILAILATECGYTPEEVAKLTVAETNAILDRLNQKYKTR